MKRYLPQMRLVCQVMWLSAVMMTALLVRADTWSGPAAGLAMRIVGKVGPGSAVALNVNNRSSLSSTDARSVTSQVESQLRAARIELVPPTQAVATVNVTLSENAEGYLWVAEIQQGSGRQTLMLPVARQQWEEMRIASALTLRRKLLLVRDEPILDVELRPDTAVVLSPTRVTWYRVKTPNWEVLQRSALDYRRAMPRDVRGRLWSNNATSGVSLPGVQCTQPQPTSANPGQMWGTVTGGGSLSCAETDDPWPVYSGASSGVEAFFSPVRNFFNGTVAFYQSQAGTGHSPVSTQSIPVPTQSIPVPTQSTSEPTQSMASYTVPPFYSVANVTEDGLPLWVFAGVDGRVSFFGGKTGAVAKQSSIQGWGSDIARVVSSCSPPTPKEGLNGPPGAAGLNGAPGESAELFVIATRAGDRSKGDAVQAFRVANREAMAVAPAVEFSGPVTALWTSSVDNATAIAVAHNLATGEYEAYSLSLVCNQ